MTKINGSSLLIQDVHQERLIQFASMINLSVSDAVDILLRKHKQGINIAQYISKTIKVNHQDYVDTLNQLGESPYFIR